VEHGFPKVCSTQIRFNEIDSPEISPAEIDVPQIGFAEVRSLEIGIPEVGFAQIGSLEIGFGQICPFALPFLRSKVPRRQPKGMSGKDFLQVLPYGGFIQRLSGVHGLSRSG
jgi:hypothetical protein